MRPLPENAALDMYIRQDEEVLMMRVQVMYLDSWGMSQYPVHMSDPVSVLCL